MLENKFWGNGEGSADTEEAGEGKVGNASRFDSMDFGFAGVG